MWKPRKPRVTKQTEALLASIGLILKNLSDEEIFQLSLKQEQFADECGEIAKKLVAPYEQAHETIRIHLTIGGLKFVACGFLINEAQPVKLSVMLDNISKIKGTRAIDKTVWEILKVHHNDFLKYPVLVRYKTIWTEFCDSADMPHYFHFFNFFIRNPIKTHDTHWVWQPNYFQNQPTLDSSCLVLRICT